MQIKNMLRQLFISNGLYLAKTKSTSPAILRTFFHSILHNSAQVPLIRVGGDGDGGYLLPDDLEGITGCFSPGVADQSDFEYAMASTYGMDCFLADFSVDGPARNHKKFTFTQKFLGSWNDTETIRLHDWIAQSETINGHGDLLLQMDIEGAEYPVLLDSTDEDLQRFRVITMEMHYLERMFDRNDFAVIKQVFDKLLKHFFIVHIHPNNCGPLIKHGDIEIPSVVEFTFLRRDRIKSAPSLTFEPHALDSKNVPHLPDIKIPECWRG